VDGTTPIVLPRQGWREQDGGVEKAERQVQNERRLRATFIAQAAFFCLLLLLDPALPFSQMLHIQIGIGFYKGLAGVIWFTSLVILLTLSICAYFQYFWATIGMLIIQFLITAFLGSVIIKIVFKSDHSSFGDSFVFMISLPLFIFSCAITFFQITGIRDVKRDASLH
jgi:hypothetical protein